MSDYEIQSREWWAQQWIYLLETSRFKKRLERARNYARQGNVLSIDLIFGDAGKALSDSILKFYTKCEHWLATASSCAVGLE